MTLSTLETAILAGIKRDLEQLRAALALRAADYWKLTPAQRHALGVAKFIAHDIESDIVPVNPAGWLGHRPNPAESMAISRAYRRLEGADLLKRFHHAYSSRTSALALTPAGEALALQLLVDAACKTAVTEPEAGRQQI